VCSRPGGHVEQVNLYSYAGYRQEALAAISNCSYFLVLPVAMMFLAFADLEVGEAFDEWVSSTPFSFFPCDASRQTSNAIRALSKDGPEHQVLQYLQHLPWLNLAGPPTGNMRMV